MTLRAVFLLCMLALPAAARADKPNLAAPILLDGSNLGEVWVYLHVDPEMIRIDAAGIRLALAKALKPEDADRISAALGEEPLVSLGRLRALGIAMRFDEAGLSLPLDVPEGFRLRKEFKVRREFADERDSIGPSTFSGYINANGSQGFSYPQSKARQPAQGSLSLAANHSGTVLESGASFTEQDDYAWRRQDTRLVRDFESRLLRATLGDLQVLTSGYQNSRPMAGISVSRQYSIQPYVNIRPLNRTELLLKRPSIVEVYVNDGFINRMSLPSGPVQLNDFPLFSGVNKVDLKITDDLGAVEWVNLNMLYDTQLLGDGIQQFAYQAGAPSETFRQDRRYDDKNLTLSAFHRMGLSDRFTLGASFQSDRDIWVAGPDFVFLTRGGLFSGEAGLSHRSGGADSGAGRLRYRSLDYKLGGDRLLRSTIEAEYKAPYFAALGQAGAVNNFSWRYNLSLSSPVTAVSNVSLALQYMVNRFGGDDNRSARLDFASEIHPQWRASLGYTIAKENRLSHELQAVLTWVQADGKYFGNLSYDYPRKTARLEASRNPSSYVGDLRATLGAQNSPEAAQGDALLEYTHEKAHLRLEQVSTHDRDTTGYRSNRHRTTLSLATAVAWAGGAVGWTRPIADSFMLLKAVGPYRNYPIPVNRSNEFAEATVNKIGAAVLPTLTSYNDTPVLLDSSDLPVGYSLGRDYLLARPTYRSGIRVDLGGSSTVMVSGKLLKPDGTPLALAVGMVRREKKDSPDTTFFTNREGTFFLENLEAGTHELLLEEEGYDPLLLRIEESQVGLIRLPPMTLTKGKR